MRKPNYNQDTDPLGMRGTVGSDETVVVVVVVVCVVAVVVVVVSIRCHHPVFCSGSLVKRVGILERFHSDNHLKSAFVVASSAIVNPDTNMTTESIPQVYGYN